MKDAGNNGKVIDSFVEALGIDKTTVVDTLEYNSIPEWDSIGHMALVAQLEQAFGVTFDTDDIISMNSVAKTREILAKYGVSFHAATP